VKVKIWGARGSIPAPGPETTRYGGNTSCVQLTLSDGSVLVLDAGTGIRNLGTALRPTEQPLHILLTHLHLDHIQGLMFFAPFFDPEVEITVWGPPAAGPRASHASCPLHLQPALPDRNRRASRPGHLPGRPRWAVADRLGRIEGVARLPPGTDAGLQAQ
jgi:phosphoribosyl 1,2-cyclic phosphodiesterase